MKKVASLAIFVGFLFLYLFTLRPGILPADSGEFQLAASQLQIAHPPGFPLYIMVGWLFTKLPGSAASNLNFLSALISSLTLALMPLIMGELPIFREGVGTEGVDCTGEEGTQKGHPYRFRLAPDLFVSLGGAVAAVLLGTSTTFWSQATTTNIRSLTTLLAALGFYFLLKWLRLQAEPNGQWAINNEELPMNRPTDHVASLAHRPLVTSHWSLLTAVLLTSLGVTHHLSLAFIALVMVLGVLVTNWRVLTNLKLVGWLASAVLIGLLPWLLLPILEPSLRNFGDFFIYVTGLGFGGDFFFVESAADLLTRLRVMWNVLTFQFHWSAVVLGLLSLIGLAVARWRVGLLLGGSFIVLTLIAATYRAPQTVEYMLPAYLPLVIGFGWMTAVVVQTLLKEQRSLRLQIGYGAILISILLAGWQTADRWPQTWDSYSWLAQQHDTADYAFSILDHAPQNATVFSSWHWFTPLSYLQQVENHRPDLNIVFVDPTFNNDWDGAIAGELAAGRPVVATNFDPDAYHILPPHLPLGEAFLWPVAPLVQLPADYAQTGLVLGGTIGVRGVQQSAEVAMSDTTAVTVGWEIVGETPAGGLKLFIHLVGSDGHIYAQQDLAVTPQSAGLSLTRFELTPRPGIPLGQAKIMLGAYLPDGNPLLDEVGEARREIAQVKIVGSRWRPVTQNHRNEIDPATGWRLVGEDIGSDFWNGSGSAKQYQHWELENGLYWTSVEQVPVFKLTRSYLPLGNGITWLGYWADGEFSAGSQLDVSHRFAADRPILRDIGIAVRQVGYEEDEFTWAWLNPDPDNDIPATGAIPTLKWIAGSRINHPRTLTIAENAAAGQVSEGFLRLYDVFTRRPVPILDERVTADGRPWVRYGKRPLE